GSYKGQLEWIARYLEHVMSGISFYVSVNVIGASATKALAENVDVIVIDPPYYDVIPYSDLMDFFYVWLWRTLYGFSLDKDVMFVQSLSFKWDHEQNDDELIDDS